MFSPEEQARIKAKAAEQAWKSAPKGQTFKVTGIVSTWSSFPLTRDDRLFLQQLHISAE